MQAKREVNQIFLKVAEWVKMDWNGLALDGLVKDEEVVGFREGKEFVGQLSDYQIPGQDPAS